MIIILKVTAISQLHMVMESELAIPMFQCMFARNVAIP